MIRHCMLVLLLGLVLLGHDSVQGQAVLETPRFSLRFDDTGHATELIDKKEGANRLIDHRGGQGFYATIRDQAGKQRDVLLRVASAEETRLQLSHESVEVRVEMTATDRYLAMRVQSVQSADGAEVIGLGFRLLVHGGVSVTPLDYMTEQGTRGRWVGAVMPYHWAGSQVDPLGAFAISMSTRPEEQDETLLHLWVNEGLPRPKVQGDWTIPRARRWLAEWQAGFVDQSTMVLGASSLEELYRLTDKAKALGMKRVYLHTDVWRGEYWPKNNSFLQINRDIFPKGEEDFRKYTAYCREQGLGVAIHIVSCSIGPKDPDYMRPRPDPRLATWVRGTLAQPVDAAAGTLHFKPEPGSVFPEQIDRHNKDRRGLRYSFMDLRAVQVGDEIIEVGQFEQTQGDVWLLKQCRRGHHDTAPAAHAQGAAAHGLYRPYGQVFVADAGSELFDEVIGRYAAFCNRNGINHMECDGLEIHQTVPWGRNKFAWKLYEQLDHPASSNTSHGSPLPYQIEYWFNSSREVMRNHPRGGVAGGEGVPLYLHHEDRVATGPYELLLKPTYRLGKGGKSFHLMRPRPMFGVSERLLEQHGLSDYAMGLFPMWREAADALTPKQTDTIRGWFGPSGRPFGHNHGDRSTDTLLRPELIEGQLKLIPLRVMQPPGHEAKWGWGQEFGPLVPRGYTLPGRPVTLNNPFDEQTPEFVIRVMNALQDEPTGGNGTTPEAQEEQGGSVLDAYNQSAGQANAIHPLAEARHIWARDAVGDEGLAERGVIGVRKTFTVDDPATLDSAVLVFHVDDSLAVSINGKAARVQGSANKAIMVDLSPYLQKGRNTLAIQASNSGGPGMVAAAVLLTRGSEQQRISSGSDWKAASKPPVNWQQAGFDDSDWADAADLGGYGQERWHRRKVEAASFDASLMPKPGQVRPAGKNILSIKDDSIRIQLDNPGDKPLIEIEQLPGWSKTVNMSSARGIAMTITGDGSGAILVVSVVGAGQRDYPVRLDFKGKRDIVIPSGELAFGSADWGWYGSKYSLQYGSVRQVRLGAAYVPANTSVDVHVENLRIMHEESTSLVNPTLQIGDAVMKIVGRVPSNTYLWYRGGDHVTLHDLNWKQIGQLQIASDRFVVPSGRSDFVLDLQDVKSQPWLEYQFVVSAPPISLKSKQD